MKIIISFSILASTLAVAPSRAAFPTEVTALMDVTVDPCEDFYQYACGKWVKNFTLEADVSYYVISLSGIADRNRAVIQEITKEDRPLVGELWESCLGLDKLTALGSKPLQRDLDRIAAAGKKQDLARLAGELGAIGPSLFTGSTVGPDTRDAKTNAIYTGGPNLVLPGRSYYLDNSTFAVIEGPFRKYISSIIKLSDINTSLTRQQQHKSDAGSVDFKRAEDIVITFETKLAQILPTHDELNNYYSLLYREAAAKYPLTFAAMTQGMGLLEKSSVAKDAKVLFNSLPFMDRAEKLFNESDLQELKVYYSFLFRHTYARFLGSPFLQARFDFFGRALSGANSPQPRERVCSAAVVEQFPDLVGKYYFLKAFDSDREQNVQRMVDAIEQAMGKHMEKLEWLDAPTRKAAEEKFAKVVNLIGHSTEKKNYPFVLTRDDYFANIQAIWSSDWARNLAKITKPVDRTEWGISAATVNAYYSLPGNQMVFPAAILQPPMFNGGSHPAQKFGAIGAAIGHELTHGFDDDGRRFDSEGNIRDWWSDTSAKEFEKRATCMKEQYSKFEAFGDSGKAVGFVDGNLTIGDNIADNGGVSLSFDAYHAWLKSGAKFNSNGVADDEADKLFFVSYAQN